MDDNRLHAYIKQVSDKIADEDVPAIAGAAVRRELKKGELLLREGEVCRSIYLVGKGHLRNWYDKDGIAINLNFTFEGGATSDMQSTRSRLPSAYNIEAGEDTVVWVFDLDQLSALDGIDPSIRVFIRRMAIRLLLVAEAHSNLLKTHTPTERYRYIEQHDPQLLQRISLSQIASYLGVSRETLSRIRGKRA